MSKEERISRRGFLRSGGRLAAGALVAGAIPSRKTARAAARAASPSSLASRRQAGANDLVNLAFVGVRGRGRDLYGYFGGLPGVRIAALCDIDGNILAERAADVEKRFGARPAVYKDQRALLEDKDIDAVVIATPNHWHALGAIWACQAGKHVYVEKPCCHNLYEGRRMVDAARRYDRVVAVGCQNRSSRAVRQAMAFLKSGGIGEVYAARGLCFKARDTIGLVPDGLGVGERFKYFVWNQPGVNYDQAYMANVDYDAWLGPAPRRPFNYNRFHYNWHWHWDYGNGDCGNQGPHQWDIARWGLDQSAHPAKVVSKGGFYGDRSAQETPNTQTAEIVYGDGRIVEFGVRGLYTNGEDGIAIGNLFYGTKGWLRLDGDEWQSFFGRKNEPGPGSKTAGDEDFGDPMTAAAEGGHFANFIKAVRAADAKLLTCPIEVGYMSSALPLLANISYRLDRSLVFDPVRERFVGDRQADRLLTRDYRKPYVVPKAV